MPAFLSTLGAVHSAPRQTITIAGTERVLLATGFTQVRFYHLFEVNDLIKQVNPKPGDILQIYSEAVPVRQQPGRLILTPTDVTNFGPGQTTKDSQHGHVYDLGVNQMWAEGVLATDPVRVMLDDLTPVVRANMIILEDAGLLETVSYGNTAQDLKSIKKGDRLWLQGRLLSEKRPDGQGNRRTYSRLETTRQFHKPRKSRPGN